MLLLLSGPLRFTCWIFFWPSIKFYVLLSPNFALSPFYSLIWCGETGLNPPRKYFTDRSRVLLLLWIFYVFSVLCLLCLCVTVCLCLKVTCRERADPLALVCGVYCEFVTFPLVSWVRCGT